MARVIKVDMAWMQSTATKYKQWGNDVLDVAQNCKSIRSSMDWEVKSKNDIDQDLKKYIKELENEGNYLIELGNYLNTAALEFQQCEQSVLESIEGEAKSITPDIPQSDKPPIEFLESLYDWVDQNIMGLEYDTYYEEEGMLDEDGLITQYKHRFHSEYSNNFITYNGDLLGPNIYHKVEMNNKLLDWDGGGPYIGANGTIGCSVFEGRQQNHMDIYGLDMDQESSIKGLNIEAAGDLDFGIKYSDGMMIPVAKAEIGASATALKGNVESRFGTEDVAIVSEAEGKVLTATAEAKGALDISKGEVHAKVEAGAAVLEGTAEAGVELFGYQIKVGVTGKAIAAGGEFEFKRSENDLLIDLGAALGVGGDLKIEVSKE